MQEMKTIVFLALIVIFTLVYVIYYKSNYFMPPRSRSTLPDNELLANDDLNSRVELTVRLTLTNKLINHLFCNLLRSATLFWNANYGDVVVILDDEDKSKQFHLKLNSLGLPFYFSAVYEKEPKQIKKFVAIGTKNGHSYGYIRMLYSSFLMDQYTTASVIAWVDTDVTFTMPVVNQSIFSNGKLIVKGSNTFDNFNWLPDWEHSTTIALGLPIVSDFMSYFPVFVYPSTIENCRKFIMKRLNANNFEDAFIQLSMKSVSPVNIIMSYAYYFERHRYEWHIDIGTQKLRHYNEWRVPKHPLLESDILPELHLTVHSGYYKSNIDPLEQAICYTQIHLGMKNLQHCKRFYNQTNMQLFEFQTSPVENHFRSWCRKAYIHKCKKIIKQRYGVFVNNYRNGLTLDTSKIKVIEDYLETIYRTNCTPVTYVPFQ